MKPSPPAADCTATDATAPDVRASTLPPRPVHPPEALARPSSTAGHESAPREKTAPVRPAGAQQPAVFTSGQVDPKSAVADACGLLLIVLAAVCVGSAYAFADLCGIRQAPHEDTVRLVFSVLAACAVLLRLTWLLIKRGAPRWVCLSAVVVGVLAVVAKVPEPWQTSSEVPGTVAEAVFHTALGWLVLEVCRRHGITATRLGLLAQQRGATDQTRDREAALHLTVVVVCFLTMDLTGWLETNLAPFGSLPVPRPDSLDAVVVYESWEVAPAVFGAVILEDLLLVGAVAALLHIARRPAWMIYTIVSVIEVAFHLHYGLAAVAFVPYALLRTWLFLRYARLRPLILGHAVADVLVLLGAPPAVALAKITITLALIGSLWHPLHRGGQNQTPADSSCHDTTPPGSHQPEHRTGQPATTPAPGA